MATAGPPWSNNTTIVNTYTNVNITKVYNNTGAPGGIAGVTNGNFAGGNFSGVRTLEPIEIRGANRFAASCRSFRRRTISRSAIMSRACIRSIPSHASATSVRNRASRVRRSPSSRRACRRSAVHAYPREAETIAHPAYAHGSDPFGRFDRPQNQGEPTPPTTHPPVRRPRIALPCIALPCIANRRIAHRRTGRRRTDRPHTIRRCIEGRRIVRATRPIGPRDMPCRTSTHPNIAATTSRFANFSCAKHS